MILSNCWVLFLRLGFNDLLKYMEKHEHSQREELVVTLVEITQKGKKLNILEIWKNYFLQVPLLYPEAFYNLLLRLPKQGFLLPSRHEYNFYKIYN